MKEGAQLLRTNTLPEMQTQQTPVKQAWRRREPPGTSRFFLCMGETQTVGLVNVLKSWNLWVERSFGYCQAPPHPSSAQGGAGET
jgi:hypothetical protein